MVDTKPSWWFQSIWILVKLDHFTKFCSFGISQLVQEFFHQTVFSLLKWASSFISKSELALPNVPSLHQFCIQNRNRNATEPMDFVYENEFRLQRVGICVGPYVCICFSSYLLYIPVLLCRTNNQPLLDLIFCSSFKRSFYITHPKTDMEPSTLQVLC